MAFLFPLFLWETWRVQGGRPHWRSVAIRWVLFAIPIVVVAAGAMLYNYLRFDECFEFGHRYLDVLQQSNIEAHGMFSFQYLSRNLAVAIALLPSFSLTSPFIVISGHGLALWLTTPLLLTLLWPRTRGPWHRPLWLTTAAVALPTLFYQNSGWVQFGYRFSLDYVVLLFALLAVGGRPLTRPAKFLIVVGVVINLFGAITFARFPQFYDQSSYTKVLRN